MACPLYPIKEIKDFSELLLKFEMGLDHFVARDNSFSIQLRDLPVFRRIKSKIEQLPFLKEIFSLNTRTSHHALKARRALGSTHGNVSIDASSYVNNGTSTDWGKGSASKFVQPSSPSILGRSASRLPPVTIQPFISDFTIDLPASLVSRSLGDAISVHRQVVEMFRKFKVALFSSPGHRVETSKSVIEYLFFILAGSSHTKLAVSTVRLQNSHSVNQPPAAAKENFKVEEEYSRQFNTQGHRMRIKTTNPEDLVLFGIDQVLAEGSLSLTRLRFRGARPRDAPHAPGREVSRPLQELDSVHALYRTKAIYPLL